MEKQNCLIYCNCGAGIISKEKQKNLAKSFTHLNIDIFELHDICAFSLNEKEKLNLLESRYEKKFIVACYPRAIDNMFVQNSITLSNYEVLNFRELTTDEIVNKLTEETKGNLSEPKYEVLKTSMTVPAWYPIIDKSRCTLCGQCAHFCVFGVYSFNKKSLEVTNPLSCKNHCPACGRTCPASAIIFPRLPENSILSGAEPGNEPKAAPAQKEGLFVMLNERNRGRRNIFKQDIMHLAEDERQKAIDELKKRQQKK